MKPSPDWISDCEADGPVLYGDFAHWCPDWGYLPIDENSPEYAYCTCADNPKWPAHGKTPEQRTV